MFDKETLTFINKIVDVFYLKTGAAQHGEIIKDQLYDGALDAFLKAEKTYNKDRDTTFKTYASRCMYNKMRDVLKKHLRNPTVCYTREVKEIHIVIDPPQLQESNFTKKELALKVLLKRNDDVELLNIKDKFKLKLDITTKYIVYKKIFEGKTFREISIALNIPLSTVRDRFIRFTKVYEGLNL